LGVILSTIFETPTLSVGIEKLAEQLFRPYDVQHNNGDSMAKDTITLNIKTFLTFIDKESFHLAFEHNIRKKITEEAKKYGISAEELIERESLVTLGPKDMKEAMVEKFVELMAEQEVIF